MKLKLFTVYDKQVDAHGVLFTAVSEGHAVRSVNAMRKNPQNPWNDSPADYELYEVGEFNDSTGQVEAVGSLRKVGSLQILGQNNG